MKVNQKVKVIITSILILIILISIAFLIKQNQSQPKPLINYAPPETVLMLELNLDNYDLNYYLDHHLIEQESLKKFLTNHDLPRPLWDVRHSQLEKVALILIQDKQNSDNLLKAWLVRSTDNIYQLEGLSLKNYFFSALDNHTAVLSLSAEAVQAATSYKPTGKLDPRYHLWPRDDNYVSYGYFRNDYLDNYLSQQLKNYHYWQSYFELDQSLFSSWQINMSEADLFMELSVPYLGQFDINNIKVDYYLPTITNSIVINQFDLSSLINIIKKQIGHDWQDNWELLQKYLFDKYQIDINELYNFFEQPAALVIQPKNSLSKPADLFDKQPYYYALVLSSHKLSSNNQFIFYLENFIQNYLAFKYPTTVKKVLPDKTVSYELAADVSRFGFHSSQTNPNLKIIKQDDFEFGYLNQDQLIVLSNSEALLLKISQVNGQADQNKNPSYQADIIINNLFYDFLDTIFINGYTEDNNLIIKAKTIIN